MIYLGGRIVTQFSIGNVPISLVSLNNLSIFQAKPYEPIVTDYVVDPIEVITIGNIVTNTTSPPIEVITCGVSLLNNCKPITEELLLGCSAQDIPNIPLESILVEVA